mgnify:CR=1 FL=1
MLISPWSIGKDFSAQSKFAAGMLQYPVTAQHCQYFFFSWYFDIQGNVNVSAQLNAQQGDDGIDGFWQIHRYRLISYLKFGINPIS